MQVEPVPCTTPRRVPSPIRCEGRAMTCFSAAPSRRRARYRSRPAAAVHLGRVSSLSPSPRGPPWAVSGTASTRARPRQQALSPQPERGTARRRRRCLAISDGRMGRIGACPASNRLLSRVRTRASPSEKIYRSPSATAAASRRRIPAARWPPPPSAPCRSGPRPSVCRPGATCRPGRPGRPGTLDNDPHLPLPRPWSAGPCAAPSPGSGQPRAHSGLPVRPKRRGLDLGPGDPAPDFGRLAWTQAGTGRALRPRPPMPTDAAAVPR